MISYMNKAFDRKHYNLPRKYRKLVYPTKNKYKLRNKLNWRNRMTLNNLMDVETKETYCSPIDTEIFPRCNAQCMSALRKKGPSLSKRAPKKIEERLFSLFPLGFSKERERVL